MLLTLLAYGIYREVRNENYDPDISEEMGRLVRGCVILWFFWPFIVIPLGAQLLTSRQRRTWYWSFSLLTLLSLIGGLGAYLLVGIFISLVKAIGYLTIAYRVQQQKERAQAAETDNESWE